MQAYQYAQAIASPGGGITGAPPVGSGPMGPPGRGPIAIANPPHGPAQGPPGRGPVAIGNPPHIGGAQPPPQYHVAGTTVPIAQPFPNVGAALAFVEAHFPQHGTVTISGT